MPNERSLNAERNNGSRSACTLVVAYMYNSNGMGTWCWEAAHALAEEGRRVLLVCAPDLQLPGEPAVPVYRFGASSPRSRCRLRRLLSLLSDRPASFLPELHAQLQADGYAPRAYVLNQTNFHSPEVSTAQYVAGWVGNSGIGVYLRSIPRIAGWRPSRRLVRCFIDCLGWYRKDWRGYRAADGVLAVTKRLADGLKAKGVTAYVVHPGTALAPAREPVSSIAGPVRVITAALDLDEPRKRISFLLDALRRRPISGITLTLAGRVSDRLRDRAAKVGVPVTFTGLIPRDKLDALIGNHDVFLFGSRSDDWGYVLIEALARGLWVVAPRLAPFDEIVGDCGELFDPYSEMDAAERLARVAAEYEPGWRVKARERAERLFSRRAFAAQILAAVEADEHEP